MCSGPGASWGVWLAWLACPFDVNGGLASEMCHALQQRWNTLISCGLHVSFVCYANHWIHQGGPSSNSLMLKNRSCDLSFWSPKHEWQLFVEHGHPKNVLLPWALDLHVARQSRKHRTTHTHTHTQYAKIILNYRYIYDLGSIAFARETLKIRRQCY